MKINELIVVEGKDDVSAVKRAVDAEVVATGGYGFSNDLIEVLRAAIKRTGVIILTDPDSAGNLIRRRLNTLVPGCKNAYLPQAEARKGHDIGVENAVPEVICQALAKASSHQGGFGSQFLLTDLLACGLAGSKGAENRRKQVGKILGIGETNTKQFLNRLNFAGITRAELQAALDAIKGD